MLTSASRQTLCVSTVCADKSVCRQYFAACNAPWRSLKSEFNWPAFSSFGMVRSRSSLLNPSVVAASVDDMNASLLQTYQPKKNDTLICTSLTAPSVEEMLQEAREAKTAGADIVELRIDFLDAFHPREDLPRLLRESDMPAIVTFRPKWEGGNYEGDETARLEALSMATELGAAYVDVELKAAKQFFDVRQGPASEGSLLPNKTKIILSSHDFESTSEEEDLKDLVQRARKAGADIVKFATTATNITDAMRVLRVLKDSVSKGIPTIALAMREKGQITRILAPKYGGFLTFGALSPDRASAPGQPTLGQLRDLFRISQQTKDTKIFGIVGNPVSHSRSPVIHNAALREINFDGVYVPLLVDNMAEFMSSIELEKDWSGLSVTIPHKEEALRCASSSDDIAAKIGAANTLVRQTDGVSFRAYNTDWSAAISAIERGLGGTGFEQDAERSPLRGKAVIVIGAGGAGRALAFGAAARGAKSVIISNRTVDKAKVLASSLNKCFEGASSIASGVSLEDVANGVVFGDVLVNTTSVGMHPDEESSPVPQETLKNYQLVFDAVYTPLETKLLQDAANTGCTIVTGEKMFVGQAADQFRLFTQSEAPVQLMTEIVLESLGYSKSS